MRRSSFTLVAFALLLTFFASCKKPQSGEVVPKEKRFQLDIISYPQFTYRFTYRSSGLLGSINNGNYTTQVNEYNTANQLVKITNTILEGWRFGEGIQKELEYGSDGRVVRIKTYAVIINNPRSANKAYLSLIDSLRYDSKGRVSRIEGSFYSGISSGTDAQPDTKSITTIEYDGNNNPAVITFVRPPLFGSPQWARTRTVYEYDDKINPIVNMLVPGLTADGAYDITHLMKNNPVRIRTYSLREDMTETGSPSDIRYTYKYQDGLPYLQSALGTDPVWTVTFWYRSL